jgi:hypothetical protein
MPWCQAHGWFAPDGQQCVYCYIDILTAKRDALQKWYDAQCQLRKEIQADRDSWKKSCEAYFRANTTMVAERDALAARVRELEDDLALRRA